MPISRRWKGRAVTQKELGRKVVYIEDRTHPDLPFYDEPDDKAATNDFLGVFTASGRARNDFNSIWD